MYNPFEFWEEGDVIEVVEKNHNRTSRLKYFIPPHHFKHAIDPRNLHIVDILKCSFKSVKNISKYGKSVDDHHIRRML